MLSVIDEAAEWIGRTSDEDSLITVDLSLLFMSVDVMSWNTANVVLSKAVSGAPRKKSL